MRYIDLCVEVAVLGVGAVACVATQTVKHLIGRVYCNRVVEFVQGCLKVVSLG
jgi:hypothetical protein